MLSSPGVEVKVIDESFYTPAEPGTVPLIIVASAENKTNSAGTGTVSGTLKANAGVPYLITSQRDLVETFGDPLFKTDANNNPIHAGEQNEYGLHAAYSLLGVSSRAFVVRADVDLDQLNPSANAPTGLPANGTYWFDTQNTSFGIFEWNGASAQTSGGQSFVNKTPIVITDSTKVDVATGGPATSIAAAIGSYAVVTSNTSNAVWYKNRSGAWVEVGSNNWANSWPTVTGTKSPTALTAGNTFTINGTSVAVPVSPANTLTGLVAAINSASISTGAVTAAIVNGKLEIYHDGTDGGAESNSDGAVTIAAGTGTLVTDSVTTSVLGIAAGTFYRPKLTISKHTQPPAYKVRGNAYPRPTGSLWVKTTEPNQGARWRIKRYNSATMAWAAVEAPIYESNVSALFNLDKTSGGFSLPIGALYVKSNFDEDYGNDDTPKVATFKVMRRMGTGATTITSASITNSTFTNGTEYSFTVRESAAGSASVSSFVTVSITATGSGSDNATAVAEAINTSGLQYVTAEVDAQTRVVIKHAQGGEIQVKDGATGHQLFNKLGFSATSANVFAAPTGVSLTYDFAASLWAPLSYTVGSEAPSSTPVDGQLWYSAVIDEVDIMVHDGDKWVGYLTTTSPFYDADLTKQTDPTGPIVSATAPEVQSDNSPLVTGDLWIDSGDTENFPTIYKFNADLIGKPTKDRWVLVDKTDQSSEDGVLFADARYNTNGTNSNTDGAISDLLKTNFVDFDAPDPALYPKGMLLWNLRRSGFNVKKFHRNYVDLASDNIRYKDSAPFVGESMESYYPHRWVTLSGNQADGSGTFGRKSQRAVVVQALQALVNSNQAIRDEEGRTFNLIACPGYPELIGEMISLNYDRGLTAFVVGDTPARLTSDATSLLAWGMNQKLALEDNDLGAASYDEYMAMFYPWGFTSDNFGNNVVVPPSHMILRTIALNDQVAYPWFAPAGLRRGGITNATAVGYVDGEGEFKSVALNGGQRDTLYEAKINPITFFTGSGLVNYGQRTRAKAASALDRINVARLVIYLRSQLNKLAKPYVMEPNDKITRDEAKAAVDSLLMELVGQRAIYDFITVVDSTNNTPARIDRNEMYIDIAIEPVKAVEMIYIPLRLKNTGEISG